MMRRALYRLGCWLVDRYAPRMASDNYVPGESGWAIDGDGNFEVTGRLDLW